MQEINQVLEIPNRNTKYRCAVIGCTGIAGQQFLEALDLHPWFKVTALYAHSRFGEAFATMRRGIIAKNLSQRILDLEVKSIENIDLDEIDLIFSAVPGSEAKNIEGNLAEEKPVISTASHYRYESDVPIFLPIINVDHAKMIEIQQQNRGWKGFICPGPNCTSVGAAIALYPIYKRFGLRSAHLVSMQAISGAGYPGTPGYDIMGNVIPYIPNEENKVIIELRKILGIISDNEFIHADFSLDAKCNRVPVIDGHIESIFFQTIEKTDIETIQIILRDYQGELAKLGLPNAPEFPITVFDQNFPFRPQPRIDLEKSADNSGMITFVGGIGITNFQNGFKMTVLSHNSQLGAGRGGVLSAEYLVKTGIIR